MDSSISLIALCLVLIHLLNYTAMARSVTNKFLSAQTTIGNAATFNVLTYGAVGDGKTDDSNAFLKAWTGACTSGGNPVLLVPQGKTFFLKPVTFTGPCKASQIQFSVLGNLVAPNANAGWTNCKENSWIFFGQVQGLLVTGPGTLDGQGSLWWGKPTPKDLDLEETACIKPTGIRFHSCNGLQLKGTTHLNSPKNHIEVEASQNVEMSQLNIIAPADSPNTDGIDISSSTSVFVHDSFIGTGDDCIAIKGQSSFINITSVRCGPGHGISVGSLGQGGATDVVEHVIVSGCTLNGTTNGARIKTFQGGFGHVSSITFQNMTIIDSKYPITIDQFYHEVMQNAVAAPPIQVSNVTFRGFQGTSVSDEAISLLCNGIGCTGLTLDNIQLKPASTGGGITARCENAHGVVVPPVIPSVACLLR